MYDFTTRGNRSMNWMSFKGQRNLIAPSWSPRTQNLPSDSCNVMVCSPTWQHIHEYSQKGSLETNLTFVLHVVGGRPIYPTLKTWKAALISWGGKKGQWQNSIWYHLFHGWNHQKHLKRNHETWMNLHMFGWMWLQFVCSLTHMMLNINMLERTKGLMGSLICGLWSQL